MTSFRFKEIADTIQWHIFNGTLKTGEKLPSLRSIADRFGVSMNTAIRAYYELESKGLAISHPKSGYTVSGYRPKSTLSTTSPQLYCQPLEETDLINEVYYNMDDSSVVRFSVGAPDASLLPLARLNKELADASRSVCGNGMRYESTQGNVRLRREVAKSSLTWGGKLTEDDIITTSGVTNAVFLALSALVKAGGVIATESPCYFGILQLANNLGINVLELPTNPDSGIDINSLEKVIDKIDACILISNFNNPLGSLMPEQNKERVVELTSRKNVPLIEDDLYGDIYFGEIRPKPCKYFDRHGNVIWCGSVSKTVAPGYRVGWMAPGKYMDKILRQKHVSSLSQPSITQETIGLFMEKARYENHLRHLRKDLQANCMRFYEAVTRYFPSGSTISTPKGGFMLWVCLPQKKDTTELYRRAIKEGISIAPGRMFTLQHQYNDCLRLSYGMKWNDSINNALRRLGNLANEIT